MSDWLERLAPRPARRDIRGGQTVSRLSGKNSPAVQTNRSFQIQTRKSYNDSYQNSEDIFMSMTTPVPKLKNSRPAGETSAMSQPTAKDWNRFWSDDQTQRFTTVSWSKRRIMDVLKPYAQEGHRALDAGCGSGFFSRYFCDRGMKTVSLDYSQSALDIASRMTNGKSVVVRKDLLADQLSKEFQEGFDLIFTDGLMEHFSSSEQNAIIQNLSNVLNRSGVLITFVPNRFSPWELIRPFYMPGIEEKPFVLNELVHLHERNRLRVIAKGGLNTFPFAFSPDFWVGPVFGMLLYVVARKYVS